MDHHKQYNIQFNNPQHQKQSYNDFNGNTPMIQNQSNRTDHILFVADLPEETSEEDIENFFKNYNFRYTKLNRNMNRIMAFVFFDTKESAEKARYELNGAKMTAKYDTN